jgi:hypothetical protein
MRVEYLGERGKTYIGESEIEAKTHTKRRFDRNSWESRRENVETANDERKKGFLVHELPDNSNNNSYPSIPTY